MLITQQTGRTVSKWLSINNEYKRYLVLVSRLKRQLHDFQNICMVITRPVQIFVKKCCVIRRKRC